MTITIRVEGAQPEEVVRGLLAAQEVGRTALNYETRISAFSAFWRDR